MSRVFIIRHGAVDNPSDRLYGQLPGYHLSELGKAQAQEAGVFMSRIPLDFIIASSLERAQETAQIIADLHPAHPPIITDSRLVDADFGKYSGVISVQEFEGNRDHYWQLQLAGEDGMESPAAVLGRMRSALIDHSSAHQDKNILFVSHGDPIALLLEDTWQQPSAPGSAVDYPKKASIFEIDLAAGQAHNIFTPTGSTF